MRDSAIHLPFHGAEIAREDEETLESPRVVEAIGPTAAVAYHALYEASGAGVDELPGGAGWRAEIEAVPRSQRHLHVHEGHMISMSPRDRRHVQPALGASMLTGTAAELREKFEQLEAGGCTDVMYCPAGDIERELRAMAKAVGLA